MIPPCDDCRPVSLKNNEEAVAIYGIVCNQVKVAGMGDVIDLDYNAIKMIMDLYEVTNQRECFEKVITIFRLVQEKIKPSPKKDRKKLNILADKYGIPLPEADK